MVCAIYLWANRNLSISKKIIELSGTGNLLVCLLWPIAWRVSAQVEISARLPGETIGPHAKFIFQPEMKICLQLPVDEIFFSVRFLGRDEISSSVSSNETGIFTEPGMNFSQGETRELLIRTRYLFRKLG